MKIELHEIPIRELVEGYTDSQEEGVYGYDGKLNIRPKYQREFVYKDAQRDSVINTVRNNFPLNVMYWVRNSNDSFEVLDGQQRTISICQYITGGFSFKARYFHNLQKDEQDKILDYRLMIYICEGTDSEKLDWFRTINIAGETYRPRVAQCRLCRFVDYGRKKIFQQNKLRCQKNSRRLHERCVHKAGILGNRFKMDFKS
ncbi:hypothetical protein TPHV1_10174 [Treponema phagedenis]|uniref:GmrSD restriction endonucleases N-terminal domain-containing protein n=1 Tax=Treponema phagedenis TaxID=162 RepID=A0A0B7GV44_TREPH|nr:DUF262 domain-containing protein [Treponema phagedenis]CEM60506.1 hypothetical protein TPHV1_10174 [Treponema phagedenis]